MTQYQAILLYLPALVFSHNLGTRYMAASNLGILYARACILEGSK